MLPPNLKLKHIYFCWLKYEQEKHNIGKLKIKKAQEDYKKQAMVLAENARSTKEREIQEMMLKLQNKTMEYQREIQKLEQDMKKPILEKLRPIIDEVSKVNKVAMTFELSAAPIVYAEEKKDLTEDVIKAYDKKYTK